MINAPIINGLEFVRRALPNIDPTRREGDLQMLQRLTSLRYARSQGVFYYSNPWRSHLLYALVLKHRPRAILEIGTGRGYSTFAMALGLIDAGVDGRIYTLDICDYEAKQEWPIEENGTQTIKHLSLSDVW